MQVVHSNLRRRLHWSIAIIMAATFATGALTTLEVVRARPETLWLLFSVHKSLGVTTFALTLGRLALWLSQPLVRLAEHGRAISLASGGVQGALVVGSFAVPILGLAADAFLSPTAPIFGLSTEALKPSADPVLAVRLAHLHTSLAYGLGGLVVLHGMAALKHHYWDRDVTLSAMLGPVNQPTVPARSGWSVLVGVGLVALFIGFSDRTQVGSGIQFGAARVGNWDLAADDSTIVVNATAEGFDITAQFTRFDAEIAFDPTAPEEALVHLTIDATSFLSGFPVIDARVEGESWLNPASFAQVQWTASTANKLADETYVMHGTLSLFDQDHPIEVQFEFVETDDGARARGRSVLNRLDVGLGKRNENASIEIEITFDFHVMRRPAE